MMQILENGVTRNKMNYHCGNDALSSSKLNELIHLDVSNQGKLFNGIMKNVTDQDLPSFASNSDLDKQISFKSNLFGRVDDCFELGLNNKKLKFSEKLKVLLKNGGNKSEKVDLNDPYTFSDIDSQYGIPSNQALNDVDSIHKNSLQSNTNSPQKSILFPKSVVPKLLVNNSAAKNEYNSDTKNTCYKNMKLAKLAGPVYSPNNALITNVNENATKVSGASGTDKFKTTGSRNAKAIASHLSINNRHLIDKSGCRTSLQNLKPSPHLNNILKGNKNASGKPHSFGQSQLFRQSVGKPERKTENKSRTIAKGKSLLNQIQKTVSFNRSMTKPRKIPSKPFTPSSGRNISAQSELPFSSNPNNKNFNKRSLLEESLLGIKTSSGNKDPVNYNAQKHKTIITDNIKYNHSHIPLETGAATVAVSSKFDTDSIDPGKKKSFRRIWNIRNKLNALKREHHHFGLSISDIEFDDTCNAESLLLQNYWFSVSNDYDALSYHDRRRDTKLTQLKIELRHKIKQFQWKYKDQYRDKVVELLVDSARKQPNLTAFLITLDSSPYSFRRRFARSKSSTLIRPMICTFADSETEQRCQREAMPCAKYCQQHISCSDGQHLFKACTAVGSDNNPCWAPVLDPNNENPLCLKHKRLEFTSEKPKKILSAKTKPFNKITQPRKRSRSSTGGSGRSGRARKRKRPHTKEKREDNEVFSISRNLTDSPQKFMLDKRDEENNDCLRRRNALTEINPQVVTKSDVDESQDVEVGEEVLAMAAELPLELANHATRLLEEHDFTNVLNHIPADAFNDLFTEDKEEYEPTPQETEELERALEAVDNDVKSLEKLSQTQGILDALLDEQAIAQTLAQLPEVTANLEVPPTLVPVFYQNGFTNLNQIEQTLQDVNKSLTQTVLLNQGTDVINNHFANNLTVPNHADLLQS